MAASLPRCPSSGTSRRRRCKSYAALLALIISITQSSSTVDPTRNSPLPSFLQKTEQGSIVASGAMCALIIAFAPLALT